MPPKLAAGNIAALFAVNLKTLEILADNLNTPFLGVIATTIQSRVKNIEVNPCKAHHRESDFSSRPLNKTKMIVFC